MKAVIQRVSCAKLTINNEVFSHIGLGYVVLLGIECNDTISDVQWLVNKIAKLRVFSDEEGKMNLDLAQINGEVLIVSQFTLHAMTHKGNRPSFIKAASPNVAIPLYEAFIARMSEIFPNKVKTGLFGADMKVNLTNDGPVTIIIDTKKDETL